MTAAWTPAERAAFEARRRTRNTALGVVLGALAVLFFGITIVKMDPALVGREVTSIGPVPDAGAQP